MWKLQKDDIGCDKHSAKFASNASVVDDEGNVWVFGCDTDEAKHNASKLTENVSIQEHDLKRVSSEKPLADTGVVKALRNWVCKAYMNN